jgi:hypothetical protein
MRHLGAVALALALAATACSGGAGAGDDGNDPADRIRTAAFVQNVQFIFLESYPVQVRATIIGEVPTPCHQAAAEVTGHDGATITIDVYSLVDPEAACPQVLDPFEVTVDLGSFETGDYTLVIGNAEYPFTI